MNYESERIESMTEILSELGIVATKEQIKQIVVDFSLNIEMEGELESYQHVGYKEECSKCKQLEYSLSVLRRENEVFSDSVKRRRHASAVWIEGDTVMYE